MAEKIGSLVVSIDGTELTAEDREIIKHPLVGGVILFTRNYESREKLTALCQAIHQVDLSPRLIMVDQEGGRVQRFISEFTRLPYMGAFGKLYEESPTQARQAAQDCGWLMATELLTAGVDLSLAPVLDLNKGLNTVIGERAFHANPQTVIQLASAFVLGMHEAGMASTGKHFPGHGSVTADSHLTIPVDERALETIQEDDLITFMGLIKSGMAAIMAAHIVFPTIDRLPVSFSRQWLKTILRDRLGFDGTVFSDDLNMEGANISTNYTDRVRAAREAGCDFALLCNNRPAVIQVLDQLPVHSNQVSKDKWGVLQGDLALAKKSPHQHERWQQITTLLKTLTGE